MLKAKLKGGALPPKVNEISRKNFLTKFEKMSNYILFKFLTFQLVHKNPAYDMIKTLLKVAKSHTKIYEISDVTRIIDLVVC